MQLGEMLPNPYNSNFEQVGWWGVQIKMQHDKQMNLNEARAFHC